LPLVGLSRTIVGQERSQVTATFNKEAHMLRITTLAAIAIAAAQPAIAAPAKEYGEGDGERFEYTTELRDNGFIHIAGIMLGTREHFILDVSPNGHVDGAFGHTAVDYTVSKKVRDSVAAQLVVGPALADATPRK
jgi:hypothetical protein